MPTITRTISAAHLTRLIDAYCGLYGYMETINNPADPQGPHIPNPESRAQFANRMLNKVGFFDPVRGWEENEARKAAINAIVITDIELT